MKKLKLFVAFLFAIQLHVSAQFIKTVDSLLLLGAKNKVFSGTVLISKADKIIYQNAIGKSDFISNKVISPNAQFQIASLSKQFTAFGIMYLHQKKRLDYDDKVQTFLPDFPYKDISIRHLLNHTSGLPDFGKDILPNLNHTISNGNNEMLAYLKTHNLSLQNIPGQKWLYSDIGYDILASIIEKIAGVSYETFMDKSVFKPNKMNHTKALMVTDIRQINLPNLAKGHTYLSDKNTLAYSHLLPKNDLVFYLGNFYGDGSVVSTANDLYVWSRVLNRKKTQIKFKMKEAYTPPKDSNDSLINISTNPLAPRYYGFGWGITANNKLGKLYYHSGGHPGFTSYFYRFVDKDITLIFLSNIDYTVESEQLRKAIISEIEKLKM
jgi:CubicO group peptidase (beta-lactamase class C family)